MHSYAPILPDLDNIGFGYRPRAAYACHPDKSRGRVFAQKDSATRAAFQRDRDRIIHSTAFRRLTHKTQVFFSQDVDLYRTRLTHSIEVSQIARAIARSLQLDEELTEAIALAHDFGHTPFGHAGERALDRSMQPYGGFDHNAQSLRIVTQLEQRYADFDGLNLSFETLDGLIKHNGPITGEAPHDIAQFDAQYDLKLNQYASLEAQAAAIADDIAYNAHDLEDGLHAGLLTLEQIQNAPLAGDLLLEVQKRHTDIDLKRSVYEVTRRQITRMVEDVVANAKEKLTQLNPQSPEDIYQAGDTLIGFTDPMAKAEQGLKRFLFDNLYRHKNVMAPMREAETLIETLFSAYMACPQHLPPDWQERACTEEPLHIHVKDFIAGMTDRFAIREYERIVAKSPLTR